MQGGRAIYLYLLIGSHCVSTPISAEMLVPSCKLFIVVANDTVESCRDRLELQSTVVLNPCDNTPSGATVIPLGVATELTKVPPIRLAVHRKCLYF